MDTVVLPVEAADYTRLADINHLAFASSPINGSIFRAVSAQARREHGQLYYAHLLRNPRHRLVKAVRRGDIVGYALWEFPVEGSQAAEGRKDEAPSWPEGTDVTELMALFEQIDAHQPKDSHYYLKSLSVDPSVQRSGAGRALLNWGIKEADAAGNDIYLESSPGAKDVYPKFGFQPVGEPLQCGTQKQFTVFPMRRRAQCASTSATPSTPSMLTSSLQILPISPPDYARLIEIETAAFGPSAINRACFASVTPAAALEHATTKRFPQALLDPQKRIIKAVRDGEIVGWAQWEVPLREGEEKFDPKQKGLEDVGYPEGTNMEEAKSLFPKFDLGIEEPHYHLSILVVDPAKHRSGAARALLQWGIEQADKEGEDIYLESSPEARAVYPKFGFSHFGSPIVGGMQKQLVVYPMRRPARRHPSPASLPPPIPLTQRQAVPSLALPTSRSQPLVDVLSASSEDLTRLATIQGLAFRPSAISRLLFPNITSEAHLAQGTKRLQKAIDHPYKAVCKAVLRNPLEGEEAIVGMALWETPNPEGLKEEEEKREWPEGCNVELAKEYFARLAFEPGVPNYHLSILTVDPEKQRIGAGTALLKWGCKKADEEGVPMYLEATDVGVPLYAKFGFKMDREPVTGGVNEEMILYPMMRSALTLSPLTRDQIPFIPQIYHLSFRPTNIMNYSFPNVTTEAFIPWVTARMERTIGERERGGKGDTIVAKRGEEVVGFAWYSYYPAAEEREKPAGEKKARIVPEGANVERVNRFLDMLEAHKTTIPEAHYSLDNLCVLPSAQRGGVGKALTMAVMDKARAEGVSMTLESTEAGIPLYTRLGFETFAQPLRAPDLPEVDLVVPMRWTPGKK